MTHLKVRNDAFSSTRYYKIVTMAVLMGNLMFFYDIYFYSKIKFQVFAKNEP